MAFPALIVASIVRFAEPWWLLAAAAAALPFALALLARKRGRRVPAFAIILQACAILAVVATLARPAIPIGPRAGKPCLLLRDVSGSTRRQASAEPSWPEGLAVEVQNFASSLLADRQPTAVQQRRTLISPALRLASSRAKNLSAVIIMTDGQFSGDRWRAAAAELGRTGVAVYIVPLDSPPADARIADFTARRDSRGQVVLSVTVTANASQRRTIRVRRVRPGARKILSETLDLLAGQSVTIRRNDANVSALANTTAVYEASLGPADAFPENDSASALLLPSKRRLAVVAEGGAPLAGTLARILKMPVSFVSPSAGPRRGYGWADYSAVLLLDAEGKLLDKPQRKALAEYVRNGGGLVLLGAGPRGSPADYNDPLNVVAALQADPARRKSLFLVVVLDASGSMSQPAAVGEGQTKFDVASEALLSLRHHLAPADAITVIAFSDRPRRIYASGSGPVDFASLRSVLRKTRPAGPTRVIPALRLAAAAAVPKGREGLILLLSDLRTERVDTRTVDRLARLLEDRRYSLAVVAIRENEGAGPERKQKPLLVMLHERLKRGGKVSSSLIRRDRLAGVAKVFAKMLRRARGDAIRHGRFTATVPRTLFGMRTASFPALDAYILCAPQPGAEVLAGVDGDPLIARRVVGLGRSVSLAIPFASPDNAALRSWDGIGALLGAAALWSMRLADDPRFDGRIARTASGARVTVFARDGGGPMNHLKLSAIVRPWGGDDETATVTMDAIGPGKYQADLADIAVPAGIVVREPSGPEVWRGAIGKSAPPEYARTGADWENLRSLEALTNGRIEPADRLAGLAGRLDKRRYTPVWTYLAILAGVLMLIEWSTVRVWRENV